MKKFCILLLAALSGLWTCEVDHGLAPLPGKLVTHVTYHGTPPANTQGVYLIVAPDFPPHAINELFQSPNSLPINVEQCTAELELPYGHYDMISLWWYNTETKSNLADWLVLPLDWRDLMPLGFDITKQNPECNINLDAVWDRVNHNAALEGTIYFNGPFPANTSVTAVAAYSLKPETGGQYLAWLRAIDFSIGANPYKFNLPITSGYIDYIAVFWLPEHANLTDFSVIGVYENPDNPGQPASLDVADGETRRGIDIWADWSKRKP